jgi:hypothetical protein
MNDKELLDKLSELLTGVSDKTVARVLQQYGKRRGIPTLAYTVDDVRDVAYGVTERRGVAYVVNNVLESSRWNSIANHAQQVFEQDLHDAVTFYAKKLPK